MQSSQKVSILGATGSIGCSTLEVLSAHPDLYQVYALSAFRNISRLAQQVGEFKPVFAVVPSNEAKQELTVLMGQSNTEVLVGEASLDDIASDSEVDIVVAAIVGAAGLKSSLAAVKAGKKILLANKESLVMAGSLFMDAVKKYDATLLPIDSEHNAIFQCLPQPFDFKNPNQGLVNILLTASGGPFRDTPLSELKHVTPEQACAHPNWVMGKKISVDSATLMNKGLELIEACWLFGVGPEKIEVVVHPQSVIHSMVRYRDGSVLAQLGEPDMKTPISYALAWPNRIDSGAKALDFKSLSDLSFKEPDEKRFPCLGLAREAFKMGGTAGGILNAANEVCVDAFLKNEIGFLDIADVNEKTLTALNSTSLESIEQLLAVDQDARRAANVFIKEIRR